MGDSAEMIFSGDELLRGDTLNTNQPYLGERLLELGIFATHALCVADDLQAMVAAIRDSLSRRPVILVLSGGLGPTEDDLTREAVAEALELPLEHHEELMEQIRDRFVSRGFTMTENNRKQALVPQGASAIPFAGTAPGFSLVHGDTLVVALPGVPWELKEMWEATVEPRLRSHRGEGPSGRTGQNGQTVTRIRVFGLGESIAADMLKELDWHGRDVTIGTRAAIDGLTIIVRGQDTPEGTKASGAVVARIRELLGERVFGVDSDGLTEVTGELIQRSGLSIAVAESCTAGLLGKRLTDVPGSSDYFLGGVTAYSNQVKTDVLGVPERLLAQYGAVSEETAAAMAQGAQALLGADCALSTTGIAGPGGGTDEKPVGLVFIGSVVHGVTKVERYRLFGTRDQIRERAAYSALDLLRRRLLDETAAPGAPHSTSRS